MITSTGTDREALRRYVRARAPDFGTAEQRDLDAWLAAAPDHRQAYARLEQTWRTLDGLAGHLEDLRSSAGETRRPARTMQRWLLGGLASAGLGFALFLAIVPGQGVTRHFETAVAQHRVLNLSEGIEVTLNADTALDLVEGKTPRIDLLRGDIYIDVQASGPEKLEVRVGSASIRDIGTRYEVAAAERGGSVAVAQGQVELRTGTVYLLVQAGHRVDFDAAGVSGEQAVAEDLVAPWRAGRWRFQATPLSALAAELARQQRVRVDIPDPAVAALTVSGSFGFGEAERVLWAAAQVHGLSLKRLGERHFQLRRGHADG